MSTTEPKNGSAVHRTAQLSVQSASADASRLHPTLNPVLAHKTAGEHRHTAEGNTGQLNFAHKIQQLSRLLWSHMAKNHEVHSQSMLVN